MGVPIILSFLAYIVGMLAIGVYFYKKTSDIGDYFLGGRQLGPAVTALSAGASDMSGWLLLGLPGYMYASGIVSFWLALGLTIGAYLNWLYVAKRLRVYTELANDSITLSDYFESRFEDHSHILRLVSAIVILIFFTLYTSSGLVGGAKLFEASFGIPYGTSLWVGAIVIISYTFLGGYQAVSWTDFIQGLLMMGALVMVPIVVMSDVGGFGAAVDQVRSIDVKRLDILSGTTFIGIISLMAWGLGYFGQPHILVRFMSISSKGEIPKARRIGMTWMILSMAGALSVGFFGIAYVQSHGISLEDSEKIFINLTQILFNPWISGILLAAILAAIMSTIDSQLLVSSSAVTEDIFKTFLKKDATEKQLVWFSRGSVIVISVIALLISADKDSKVLSLVSYAWGGFGAAFGPVVLFSLFWRGMSKNGALFGMIAGAVTVVVWKNLSGGIFDLYEIVPGFLLCSLVIVVLSLREQPSASILQKFESVEEQVKL